MGGIIKTDKPVGAEYGSNSASKSNNAASANNSSRASKKNNSDDVSKTDGSLRSGESSSASQPDDSDDASIADGGQGVREKRGVTMYLPDELVDDLDFRFDELNVQYRREHGEKMEKNKDFYPAMVRATINNTTIEAELDLE